jgi:hypothetical protein
MDRAPLRDDDDDAAKGASIALLVGDLRGRARAHEQRMDRHETWVGENFSSVNRKVDSIEMKVDTIGESIAELKEMLAGQAGSRAAFHLFFQPATTIIVAAISGVVGITLHLYFKVMN